MSALKPARLRTALWTLHRWIGIGVAILLVPIAVSGALLVWHDHLDALIHPSRYAVSGSAIAQPPSAYLTSAATALAGNAQPVAGLGGHGGQTAGRRMTPGRFLERSVAAAEPGARRRMERT